MPNDFLEKTLEDIIFENKDIVHERGFCLFKSNTYRQVILPSGRRIDILSFSLDKGDVYMDIYELKKDRINMDAVSQAYQYYEEIDFLMQGYFKNYYYHLILVGKTYESMPMLNALSIPTSVYTYEYSYNGISFNKMKHNKFYCEKNRSFPMGVWAFGLGMLKPSCPEKSIQIHSGILEWVDDDKDFSSKFHATRNDCLYEPKPPKQKNPVETVIFPLQPQWSVEFEKEIPPPNDIMEDHEIDDSDLEPEYESDFSDYEVGNDIEEFDTRYSINSLICEIPTITIN